MSLLSYQPEGWARSMLSFCPRLRMIQLNNLAWLPPISLTAVLFSPSSRVRSRPFRVMTAGADSVVAAAHGRGERQVACVFHPDLQAENTAAQWFVHGFADVQAGQFFGQVENPGDLSLQEILTMAAGGVLAA